MVCNRCPPRRLTLVSARNPNNAELLMRPDIGLTCSGDAHQPVGFLYRFDQVCSPEPYALFRDDDLFTRPIFLSPYFALGFQTIYSARSR